MQGSIFVATKTEKALHELANDLDYLDQLQHVSLDQLTTIDFEMTVRDLGVKWTQGNPLIFEQESGLAIFKIAPAALEQMALPQPKLEIASLEDMNSLRSFITENGTKDIYELVAF